MLANHDITRAQVDRIVAKARDERSAEIAYRLAVLDRHLRRAVGRLAGLVQDSIRQRGATYH